MIEYESSAEALCRKNRSIALLQEQGIPFLASLPVIETVEEATVPTASEVVERAVALCCVALKGEGLEIEDVTRFVEEWAVLPALSPRERAFVDNPDPSTLERTQFTWRYECLWTMLWALELIDDLGSPGHVCDAGQAASTLLSRGSGAVREYPILRDKTELLDMDDLYYRYHWAARNAQLTARPVPAPLDPGVVMERYYALNWLIHGDCCDWDDVDTST